MNKTSDKKPIVHAFFDEDTNTISYVAVDKETNNCAIIDPVLDFNYSSGKISYKNADKIIDLIKENDLNVEWLIETHVHADHLSAAPYIQDFIGGKIAISAEIKKVQDIFGKVFNAGTEFERDGSQFDKLFDDGSTYNIGKLSGRVIHTPGHTPACNAHLIGDAVFVGDTLFMPDAGTARTDFPGGDARLLYRSIHKIFSLPDETRLFVCHDYGPNGREFLWETTVGEERKSNIHIGGNVTEGEFFNIRTKRDSLLEMPQLIIPSIQVNMRGGHMPPAEDNGNVYFKIPVMGLKEEEDDN
ncbi:MAG: MBL fold metallo-hydrolase [Rhodobiaceae bacterium]|nr:MBL fold metallo-hydrolase [Rhodobiaceae bacterium]